MKRAKKHIEGVARLSDKGIDVVADNMEYHIDDISGYSEEFIYFLERYNCASVNGIIKDGKLEIDYYDEKDICYGCGRYAFDVTEIAHFISNLSSDSRPVLVRENEHSFICDLRHPFSRLDAINHLDFDDGSGKDIHDMIDFEMIERIKKIYQLNGNTTTIVFDTNSSVKSVHGVVSRYGRPYWWFTNK